MWVDGIPFHRRPRRRGRRGQALLEGALVTLVFVVLLIGVLDIGQFLFVHQTLVERGRNALRYGVVRPFDANAIRNMVLYNQPTAPASGGQTVPGVFGLTPAMVTVTRQDATWNEDRIVLTISDYPFRFFTPLIAGIARGKPITVSLPYEAM
jgi:Flp pilus assembly protein TadG